jgi:hypothetical protein
MGLLKHTVPWQVRVVLNSAILACLVALGITVGARADGVIGASWAVTMIPAWVALALLLVRVNFVAAIDASGAPVTSELTDAHRSPFAHALGDVFVPRSYTHYRGVPDIATTHPYHRHDGDVDSARISLWLYMVTLHLFVPCLALFAILLAVHLDTGDVEVRTAIAPVISWISWAFLASAVRVWLVVDFAS